MTYLEILRHYWGYDSFRGIQQDIIESIGSGRDTLGLMPTGGGKSVCFQVPALAKEGLCLVISPLISLMKDQVKHLREQGIKAAAVHTGMYHSDIVRVIDNCILGDYKFLYLSPERLSSPLFLEKLQRMRNISMIVVDEAHCISQWGYDFRPAYMDIARLRHQIRYAVPVLALTATATPRVVDDIQERLEFREKNVFSMSFERKNLTYVVRQTANKEQELLHILRSVPQGSAIVYTRSRRLTSELAQMIDKNGITAENYHAGLTSAERDLRQTNWNKGRDRVMVATNAFGMGIDKSNVRLVIHYNVPDSIEAYFQEAGRAGRDGKTAYAVLLYDPHDQTLLRRRVPEQYPDPDYIRQTYENICYFYQIGMGEGADQMHFFHIDQFCATFKQFPVQTDSALRILHNAKYIDYQTDNDMRSRLRFALQKDELYRLREGGTAYETLMSTLMRTYAGIFADYVLIDEMQLAHATGLSADTIYQMLKDLAERRIIDYIPHNNTPTLMLRTPRVETDHISLPPSVYADRKSDYNQRIEQILHYASSTNICRSRILLQYFGQADAEDCGHCDVCLSKKKDRGATALAQLRQTLLATLQDRDWHTLAQLQALAPLPQQLDPILRQMAEEEQIEVKGTKIRLR